MNSFYLKVFSRLNKTEQQETLKSFLESDNIILSSTKEQVKVLELLVNS